jgi:hypothetical protein
MLTHPISVWRGGWATLGLFVRLRLMLLIAWPALGLAGVGAIVQAVGITSLSPTHDCPLDGSTPYVTQEAVASMSPAQRNVSTTLIQPGSEFRLGV